MPVPDPFASRAVLVGVDGYSHRDLAPLPAAAAGAHRLAELLRDPSVWGLPAAHVTVLGADASMARVLGAVRDAALEATDTLFVYFAGHGLRDRDEKLYLALAEADADHPQIGTVPYRALRDVVRQAGYRARHRVTVLDCCYSGLAGAMSAAGVPTRTDLAHALDEPAHPGGNRSAPGLPMGAHAVQDPNGDAGRDAHGAAGEGDGDGDGDDYGDCVLTSAPPTRRSFVPRGARFPEFTGLLITLLEHGVADAGAELSLEDAWRRILRRMRERGSPEPQQFAQNSVAARIHLRNRAAATGRATAPTGPAAAAGTRSAAGMRSAAITPAVPATSTAAFARARHPGDAPPGRGFENGPLAVIDADAEDGRVRAHCAAGAVLDCPARTLDSLLEWALTRARLGAPRLHRNGKEADPLLVLTAGAAVRFGLPSRPEGLSPSGVPRLPDDHEVLKQLRQADWQPTEHGFGPWARLYRPVRDGRRRCVQLCLLPWGALDPHHWGPTAQLPPAEVARLLGAYAERIITPHGSAAATGLSLMTALRPPTRAVRNEWTGSWVSAPNPGALTGAVDCAPCEAPDGHPMLAGLYPPSYRRTPDQVLREEAHRWSRPLTGAERLKAYVVGIRVTMPLAAAASRLRVGLDAPVHVERPVFDPSLPGSWLVDLSPVTLDQRLPSPFTPDGRPPAGAAWYTTPTLAYAVELGFPVQPVEAYVRTAGGAYLDPWYKRIRDGYLATMADLGVGAGLGGRELLDALAVHRQGDPGLVGVLDAIAATAEGGVAKLGEGPPEAGRGPRGPWSAPQRATWRPDIRAAVAASARVNTHRKMVRLAQETGLFPVAVSADRVVYASDGPSPLDLLPHTADGKPLPGTFRLGVSPGMATHAGTRTVAWAERMREEHGPDVNIADHIGGGPPTADSDADSEADGF
ncbi:telomere-associated protein Tap [Streptomyces sp. NPDC058412]|uniref:telomere-associated protein Tap n=1 Tax=Streptomyces sp. NPDC058412 TaxID=3346486 RepID=UPI00365178A7